MSQSADALRSELLRAAGDDAALESLCRDNAEEVRRHFASWARVPKAVMERDDLAELYVRGLVAVAQTFADKFDDPSLLATLSGSGEAPTARWDRELKECRELMGGLRLKDAAARLTDLAIDVGRLKGSAVAAYLPVVLATLGECHFQAGQAGRAVEPSRQALEMARKAGDATDLAAYLGNLYETHRYLGQCEEAAGYADELAALAERVGDAETARRYRGQARLVRAGEPKLRVVLDVAGKRHELDEVLQGVVGSVKFVFERNRLALPPSLELTRRGEREASQGKFAEALGLFREASEADPFNPQPVYESAVVLMYLGRPGDAVEYYERTEELAPGWFHCRTEGWLAGHIVAGRYARDAFLTLHNVQGGALNPAVKMQLVGRALKEAPDLAPMHHQHGKMLAEGQQAAGAIAAYRRGLECAEEDDIRTRLLVDLASVVSDDGERRDLCRQARELNGNLVASATAAVVLAFG